MWKKVRIFILLVVLGVSVKQIYLDKADLNWKNNFYVAVYPINIGHDSQVDAYIKSLNQNDFTGLEDFFTEEAKRYGVTLYRPIAVELGQSIDKAPEAPPVSGSALDMVWWSLKLRWFAWKNSPQVPVPPDIKLYLLYYNPQQHPSLQHSTALQKGRIGRVNLFGDKAYSKQNLVVVAHELLHTLSATDKYDLASNLPMFPDGFAEPDKQPRYPQNFAELMGGYLPKSEVEAVTPKHLGQVLIGNKTAKEIGWLH